MNPLLIVGALLNVCFALLVAANPVTRFLAPAFLLFGVGQVVGLTLVATNRRRMGARLVLLSSLLFVPLGLIAVLGARQVLDRLERDDFCTRRSAV